jgi:putative flippase GtrA
MRYDYAEMLQQLFMIHINKLLSLRLGRFLVVGLGNTTINFAVLNIAFYCLRLPAILASILATSCAILCSFLLNRNFVFRDRAEPLKKLVRFTFISAAGVLLVQTSSYAVFVAMLKHFMSNELVAINLGNLIASFVVMFWNYNGYRLVVFKPQRQSNALVEADDAETA